MHKRQYLSLDRRLTTDGLSVRAGRRRGGDRNCRFAAAHSRPPSFLDFCVVRHRDFGCYVWSFSRESCCPPFVPLTANTNVPVDGARKTAATTTPAHENQTPSARTFGTTRRPAARRSTGRTPPRCGS